MSKKKAKQKTRQEPMVTIEYECEDSKHIPIEGGGMTVSLRCLLDAMCLCNFIKSMIAEYSKVQITFSKEED